MLQRLDDRVAGVHRRQLRHMSRAELQTLADLLARARSTPR